MIVKYLADDDYKAILSYRKDRFVDDEVGIDWNEAKRY